MKEFLPPQDTLCTSDAVNIEEVQFKQSRKLNISVLFTTLNTESWRNFSWTHKYPYKSIQNKVWKLWFILSVLQSNAVILNPYSCSSLWYKCWQGNSRTHIDFSSSGEKEDRVGCTCSCCIPAVHQEDYEDDIQTGRYSNNHGWQKALNMAHGNNIICGGMFSLSN